MLRSVVAFTALASGSAFAPALTQTTLSRPRHGSSMRMQESLLEGKARRVEDIRAMQPLPSSLEQKVRLTPELFRQLDVDNSGTIEVGELKDIFKSPYFESIELDEFAAELTADTLFKRADLDGNGRLDYAEYERLMNMQKNGDEWGGNKYVRAAIKAGLLKPDSPLADGEASVLVGNKGFDPVGFATSLKTLKAYREAELKHGRLAMLAALGWPVSELVHPYLAKLTGAGDLLVKAPGLPERVPSVLNGGLDSINPLFFLATTIFSGAVESAAINKIRGSDYIPGDLGFDPLKIYQGVGSAEKRRELELKELNNGRLAMLAITGYAAQEFATKVSVVGV